MSLSYIRKYYGVPANRGARVEFQGATGVIAASSGSYLRVRFGGKLKTIHPTWGVTYLPRPADLSPDERRERRHQERVAGLNRRDNVYCSICGAKRGQGKESR